MSRPHSPTRPCAGAGTRAITAARALAGLLAAVASLGAGAALGQDAGAVSVELNRLEPAGGACQAYLVIGNRTQVGFESLGLDLVIFDPEGIVSQRLAVELAPLPAGKTSVRVFPVEGASCDAIGRVLLNSVVSCRDGSGERPGCLDLVETSSRAGAPFIE